MALRTASFALVLALASGSARAADPAPAPAAQQAATVLVLPFETGADVPGWVGLALAEELTDLVAQEGRSSFLTLKQVDAVLRRDDLRLTEAGRRDHAVRIGRALGATDVVTGKVQLKGGRYELFAERLSPTGQLLKTTTVTEAPKALPGAIVKVAVALLDVQANAAPATTNVAALEQAVRCEAEVIRQPLGPRALPALSIKRLEDAQTACDAALKADPKLALARAGHAIVLTGEGRYTQAREEAQAAGAERFTWLAPLVASYAARNLGDRDGARTILEDAVAKKPGFLQAIGYLGEERLDAGDFQAALSWFDKYLAVAPQHPWAMAQKAHALARLGRADEAIALTQTAVALDQENAELKIELVSRLLDANKDDEARKVLDQLSPEQAERPLALLRRGYLELRQKHLREARRALTQAAEGAFREDESRTRGLAHADLALVAALEKRDQEALEHLRQAVADGVRSRIPCQDPALARLRGQLVYDDACPTPTK